MRIFDRAVLVALTVGIWSLVALQVVHPAAAVAQPGDMPLQNVFNQYLTTAITQAKAAASGCHIKGTIHGTQLDAQVMC
jgi:hypothetical protein